MTTEQKLRQALADVMAQGCGQPKSCGHEFHCICPGESARAALALPPSETREEWRVLYFAGGVNQFSDTAYDRHHAEEMVGRLNGASAKKARIESRTRTVSAGPWTEASAPIPPSPQAECAALIGRVFDKLIDAAPRETICAFAGLQSMPCQVCGKSWMAPDHQAPLFDPRTPR